jgi:hypothetical protein
MKIRKVDLADGFEETAKQFGTPVKWSFEGQTVIGVYYGMDKKYNTDKPYCFKFGNSLTTYIVWPTAVITSRLAPLKKRCIIKIVYHGKVKTGIENNTVHRFDVLMKALPKDWVMKEDVLDVTEEECQLGYDEDGNPLQNDDFSETNGQPEDTKGIEGIPF